MKKFLIAAATSLLIFGGQVDVEASTVEQLNAQIETQEMKAHGKWAHFRDKYLLGRETENEYRDRKEWERRHRDDYERRRRDDYYRHHRDRRYYRDDDYYYDPPPRYRYPPPPHGYPPPPRR